MDNFNYDIIKVLEYAQTLQTTDEKLKYLLSVKSDWEIYRAIQIDKNGKAFENSIMFEPYRNNTFSKQCQSEIDKLEQMKKLNLTDDLSILKQHESNIRRFIDIATRYPITEDTRNLLKEYYKGQPRLDVKFGIELPNELSKHQNPQYILIDLQKNFFPMIDKYILWFDEYKTTIEQVCKDKTNYYNLMYSVVTHTKMQLEKYIETKPEQNQTEIEYPDYSDTSYPEKFVMLHQLGIIDYLKEKLKQQPGFTYSDKKMASLITSFATMDIKNLRRDINSANTGDIDHRNKIIPSNVEKVKMKLLTLGIKPETFNIK